MQALMAWLYLLLAGAFEIGFTSTLRFFDGFRNILPARRSWSACC